MNIRIVTDSTCDLTPEIARRFGITIIPMTVIAGDRQYKDGIEMNPPDVFAYYDKTGKLCSTTAVNEAAFREVFAELSPKYDAVIYIGIGAGFSACCQNASIAAQDFSNVYIIDSENLTSGQGLLNIEAAVMAKNGATAEEICQRIPQIAKRVESSFIIDRLDYMSKGGRCSSVTALGANLLRIKPCIAVKDGQMIVDKKFRGRLDKALRQYIADRLEGREDIDRERVFITYSSATEEMRKIAYEGLEKYGRFNEIFETNAGCTVACHCGPLTLGILFIRKG